jgi:hypothetical protein
MKGDLHVRFCENTEVKFFCVTRLAVTQDAEELKLSLSYAFIFLQIQRFMKTQSLSLSVSPESGEVSARLIMPCHPFFLTIHV